MLAYDISSPEAPHLLDELYDTPHSSNPGYRGSDYYIGEGAAANDRIALIPSTTQAGNPTSGTGQVLIVDISNPSNLSILNTLQIPGTRVLTSVAVQGNRALVVGNTGSFVQTPSLVLNGNLTLTVLDITDPEHPAILGSTLTTAAQDFYGYVEIARAAAGANGFYSVCNAQLSGQPVLMLVNAGDPENIEVTTMQVPAEVIGTLLDGNTLYAVSSSGLAIYDVGNITGTAATVRVQIPKGSGVSSVDSSFNVRPDQIVSGDAFDTLVWHSIFTETQRSQTLTWQSSVSNLQPGEVRETSLGADIDFVTNGAPGHIALPPMSVACGQILGLDQGSRTVRPGEAATFMLTVRNPLDVPTTYNLSLQGIPQEWVDLAALVTVPAGGTLSVPLSLKSESFAALGEYGFTLSASSGAGAVGSVLGTLVLEGAPVVASDAHGVVLSLTPTQATAGQGTPATFAVRITNTGNVAETYSLAAGGPANLLFTLGQQTVEVPPGLDNYREVSLTVTPQPGSSTGAMPFTVSAVSTVLPSVSDQKTGTLTVVANGVHVAINPTSGVPGSAFQLTVTNTGGVDDTFDLALGGPAGPAASLAAQQVSLARGASQNVAISLSAIDFAYPGTLDLTVVATSRGNSAVQDHATAKSPLHPRKQ